MLAVTVGRQVVNLFFPAEIMSESGTDLKNIKRVKKPDWLRVKLLVAAIYTLVRETVPSIS
jgi:hypothetical protein